MKNKIFAIFGMVALLAPLWVASGVTAGPPRQMGTSTLVDVNLVSAASDAILSLSDQQESQGNEAASQTLVISSSYVETPPIIDGVIGFGEWQIANQIAFDHGFITVLNDEIRLYILVDVLGDTTDDPPLGSPPWGDYFWLTFDVDKDGEITEEVDLNYGLFPGTYNMRFSYYLGPGTLTGLQPSTLSSMATGFGCFFADGTSIFVPPFYFTCSSHRVWEFGIDLAEIGAEAGETVRVGLRIYSHNPSFTDDVPADFFLDFTDLIEISLASPPTAIPTPDPNASITFESDAIEVTQAIQDRQNTLPLVRDKSTVARMYVDVSGVATSQPVIVYLYGTRGGNDLPGSPLSTLFIAPTTIDREQLDDTANFLLPSSWVSGTVEFQGLVRDLFGNEVSSIAFSLTFTPTDVPLYWIVPINTGTSTAPVLPSNADIAGDESYLETVYPVPYVRFVRKPWQVIGPTTVANTINELNDYLGGVLIAWSISVLFTGEEPFELPDQIYGFTPSGGGKSDPVWAGGFGYVARGPGFTTWGEYTTMAHEINHNLDKSTTGTWGRHVPFGCNAAGPDPNWLYPNDDIQEVGFDTRLPWVDGTGTRLTVIPSNYPDFMSYCSGAQLPRLWISPYRWKNLFDLFSEASSLSAASINEIRQQIQTVYYVSGQVNKDGTGSLDPVLVQPGIPTRVIKRGDYAIEVQDAFGRSLLTTPFFVSFIDVEGNEVETVHFNFQIPEQTGAARILLKRERQILDVLTVSDNPPTVTVLSPNGGESWSGLQTIRWEAEDLDQDPLSFTILYTPDDGRSWFPVASGVQGDSFEVDTSILPGGDGARIRVIATDGFNTAQDDSDGTFTVAGKPPEPTIMLPEAGAQFASGELISFHGEATDAEDESIPDASFIWSYDSIAFATGREVTAILPDGVHEVTLTVVDSDGNTSEDEVVIFVNVHRIFLPVVLKNY